MTSLSVKVSPSRLGTLYRQLGKGLNKYVERALKQYGKDAVVVLKHKSAKIGPAGSTGYKNAWAYTLPTHKEVLVFNRKPYAKFIETGRRPGARMPPVDALIPWVRAIGYVTRAPKGRLSTNQDAQIRSKAFAIARSIGKKGIRPRLVMLDPNTQSQLSKKFSKAMTDAMRSAANEAARTASRGGKR